MNRLIKNIFFFLVALLYNSCAKLNPNDISSNVTINGNGLVVVGNEGNFGFGNASLSIYNKNSSEISNNVYQNLNQSLLGDVLHSISHIDHQLFLIINNSGKIIIINDETFKFLYQIDNMVSPRKIIKINNSKYYITDIYSNSIYIYNTYQNSLSEIPVNGWCEDIIIQNEKVFVCNKANNQIYIINSNSDFIVDSISVGANPVSIKEDLKGNMWILCQGNITENPSIYLIKSETSEILRSFNLENNQSYPSSLNIHENEIYFINKHIYKIQNINDSTAEIVWSNDNNTFYNLSIDPYIKDLYITDAKDYVQNGTLLVIDSNGNLKNEVTTGIIPKSIIF